MAVYAGMSAAGGALGLLLGGVLVDFFSWRWVLFVNVPIGTLLLLLSPKALRETPTSNDRLDLPGAVSASVGMALLVYGLIRVPSSGWTNPTTLGVFLSALVVLIGFVIVEAKTDRPLLPLEFLANRNRSGGYLVMLLLGGAMLSLLFFLTQFLQDILHYSPIDAGFAYLPLPMMVASSSIIVSRQVRRFGTRPFLTIGPLFVAVGLFWASYITFNSSYPAIFGPLVTVGLGMGLTFVTLTLNAVSAVAPRESGLASALLNTSQQIGGSLGLAALVTLMATSTANSMKSAQVLIKAASKADPNATTTALASRLALNASVHGYQVAFKAGSIFALVAFVVAALVIRSATKPASHADILLAEVK
jgi:MFS family permease